MKNLQFCEQCQIYHNVSFVRGQKVLTQCERKINQTIPTEQNFSNHQIGFYSKKDLSPTSRASFTSINNHLHPSQIKQSRSLINFPPPRIEIKMIQSTIQRPTQISFTPLNQQQNNSVRINFQSPPQTPIIKQVVQPNPVVPQPNYKVGGLLQVPINRSILSTIKEEGPDESEKSRSVMSISNAPISYSRPQSFQQRFSNYENSYLLGKVSNFQKDQVLEQNPVITKKIQKQNPFVFKSFQKNYEFRNMKKHLSEQDNENQSSCWCW